MQVAMGFFRINRNYKNFARLVKILSVLGKYGFSAFLKRISDGLGAIPKGVVSIRQERTIIGMTEPERLRLAIEELGPAFIKLGQILSLRPDIIPPRYARELEKLQDRTSPVPFIAVRKTIEEEFGTSISDIFSSIEEQPVASGSIAQVHRAVLRDMQEEIAVKILKPRTRQIVETDLNIIRLLVRLASGRIPEFQAYNLTQIFGEFSEILLAQLNFLREAKTIERFSHFFRGDDYVHIPRVYMDYTTESCIVMEFIDGVKISDVERLEREGMDKKEIAKNGAMLALREILDFGFYHADPHPGNLFVLPGNVIVPVDFGITGYIDEEGVLIVGNILLGLIERDVERILRYFKRYDFVTEDVDEKKLKIDLYDLIDTTKDAPLSRISITSSIRAIFTITRKYHIRFPGEYFLIFNTLLESDGVGRMVDPDFNITEFAKPWVRRWAQRQYSPKRYMKDLFFLIEDLGYFIKLLPSEINVMLRRLRSGKIRLPLYHENLEKAVSKIDRTGNRLSFAVIIAALLLSSTILVQAKVGPFIRGYPVLGLAGFFTAFVMGLWLLLGIIRSGKL
jgi:ubiquinone biosynthesis protein